jgi:hypothetical protein
MRKSRSVKKDWEFVSKGTYISLGKFVSEYFTPLTLNLQTRVVSTEDMTEIWETEREEAIEKVRGIRHVTGPFPVSPTNNSSIMDYTVT